MKTTKWFDECECQPPNILWKNHLANFKEFRQTPPLSCKNLQHFLQDSKFSKTFPLHRSVPVWVFSNVFSRKKALIEHEMGLLSSVFWNLNGATFGAFSIIWDWQSFSTFVSDHVWIIAFSEYLVRHILAPCPADECVTDSKSAHFLGLKLYLKYKFCDLQELR